MGTVLQSGGEWFLGVGPEQAQSSSAACFVAAGIYGIYLLWCGSKVMKASAKAKLKGANERLDSADEEEL